MELQILPPSRAQLMSLGGVPPLGTLLVLVPVSTTTTTKVLHLLRHVRDYPWCPLLLPPIAEPAAFESLGVPASRLVLVDLQDPPEAWRAVVRCRPMPTYREWITALALRLESTVVEAVRSIFERVSEGSAIRRQLRRLGVPSPGDWRDIHVGCVCLADALRTGDAIGIVAARHGLTGTRLAAIARRCFGLGWHQMRALGAWEPALEQALRFRGVVTEPELPPSLPPSLNSAGRPRVTRRSSRRVPWFWDKLAHNRLSTGLRASGSL